MTPPVNDPHDYPPASDDPSIGQMFGLLAEQTSRLVHAEIALAKAEMTAKLRSLAVGLAMFSAAGVLALYALDKLFDSAALGMSEAVAPWLGFLIIAVVQLIVVVVLLLVGKKMLTAGLPPTPDRAIASLKDEVESLKEGLKR